jgi:D-threo-aldose 1-dehydrogenase
VKVTRIGNTSVELTAVGLGTAQLGDLYQELTDDDATAVVDAAWDAGIRYFDTAPHYGLGLSERRLGEALRPYPRDSYAVSTKVGWLIIDADGAKSRCRDFTADGVVRSVHDSLSRLGMDRIDMLLVHDPQNYLHVALTEAVPALVELRDAGVVGAIGVGSGDLDALLAFARHADVDMMMIAGRYTLLDQAAAIEIMPTCARRGIHVVLAGVFNSGLLADPVPSVASRYEYEAVPETVLGRARALSDVCASHGTTARQAALQFSALSETVASIVVGAETPEQVRSNAQLFAEHRDLEPLWRELYARQFIEVLPRLNDKKLQSD